MKYYHPFGEVVHPLVHLDRCPKQVFVLGVYASAVHARWRKGNKVVSAAIAVASEPRIFWDGNSEEATEIISKIHIPEEMGTLEPAGSHLNGPSAKVLDNNILAPLGFAREDAWLCDLLPETRLNPNQIKVINNEYEPEAKKYGLPLQVEVEPLRNFYPADEYHQDYLDKNPNGYCHLPVALFELAKKAKDIVRQ